MVNEKTVDRSSRVRRGGDLRSRSGQRIDNSKGTWMPYCKVETRGRTTVPRADFDYHGAIVVVEMTTDEIVFVHPGAQTENEATSLPASPCPPTACPPDCAVRIVREMIGLEVTIAEEFTTFIQEGTPTGTMYTHGYVARPTGGILAPSGTDGPVSSHRVRDLPPLIPVRAAVRRVIDAYLDLHHSVELSGGEHGDS